LTPAERFVHRLALEIHMTTARIKEEMGVEEMLDWVEYFSDQGKEQPGEMSPEQLANAFGANIQR
jgi:hypothetical protein